MTNGTCRNIKLTASLFIAIVQNVTNSNLDKIFMTVEECIWNRSMLVWIKFVKFDASDLFGHHVNEIISEVLFINLFFVMTVVGDGILALLV